MPTKGWLLGRAVAGRETLLHPIREEAEVVGPDCRHSVIVHREVGQERNGPALARLKRDHGQIGVCGTGRPGRVFALVAGMHVCPDGRVAEGIVPHAVRTPNPPPHRRVRGGVTDCGSDLGRFEDLGRLLDRLYQTNFQERRVIRISVGAQPTDSRRGRMGVRGRDQHVFRSDAGALLGQCLGLVKQCAGHRTAVNYDNRQTRGAVIEHDRLGEERCMYFCRRSGEHRPDDDHGKLLRRHIDGGSTGPELGKTWPRAREGDRQHGQHDWSAG